MFELNLWDVMRIDWPIDWQEAITFQSNLLPAGSINVVGSSNKIKSGSPIIEIAMFKRRRLLSFKVQLSFKLYGHNSTTYTNTIVHINMHFNSLFYLIHNRYLLNLSTQRLISNSIHLSGTPLSWANNLRCSLEFSLLNNEICWGQ